jgi:hypothetical protein
MCGSASLDLGDLALKSGHANLLLFERMERSSQARHPAVEAGLFLLELSTALLKMGLLAWILSGWPGGPKNVAAGCGHGQAFSSSVCWLAARW